MYVGIDGCKAGWIVATINSSNQLSFQLLGTLLELDTSFAKTVYIDIPLGFAQQHYRACEIEARRLLGHPKRASVFLTPSREAVYAETFATANRINKSIMGKGVSIQAWNICSKIREAAAFSTCGNKVILQEAHPELCFYFLNNQKPLLSKKSSAQGIADRKKIIAAISKQYENSINETIAKTKRKAVQPDDVLDAAILAIRAGSPDPQSVLPYKDVEVNSNIYF